MITELSKPARALAAALLLLAVAGCADKTNPDNVDRRVVERWNLLIAHDAGKAYDYLTPGYRSTHPRETYVDAMNNRPLQWKNATFNHKDCEEDRCTVVVDVAYTLKMSGGAIGAVDSKSAQTETWIRIDGDWYFLPK